MKINRLFGIVYILLQKDQITAQALAEHFEVSVRTIYRDVETLSQADIPIYTTKGKGGGIRLLSKFVLNKSVLTAQEQDEILLGLQSLGATNFASSNSIQKKLLAFFGKQDSSWIEVDFSPWGSDSTAQSRFALIKNALIQCQVLRFDYYSTTGEKSTRIIHPAKLAFKMNTWYLYGFCVDRNDFRLFRLSRIHQLVVLDECFEPFEPILLSQIFSNFPVAPTIPLVMQIYPPLVHRVFDEFEFSQIQKNSDDSYTVSADFIHDDWLFGFILSFGSFAKVLSPDCVKVEIKKRLQKMLADYS